ncbi:MAG: DNA polymerase/3'-5' exonuclease PolX [Dehalococcoidales bacterium]|jgi:DNA polymerase (family 10)|nr:DNA polymerase/3'-5' exonuclease PolX [Dehalococcoidales bacterium]
MNNAEIVKILQDIADLLELKGENVFKVRAYQKAARSIEFLSEDVEKLVRENRLREVPGIGEAIEKKITELVNTGKLEYYEKLKAEFPEGIGSLLEIPGIGPRTALILTRELGITSVDELEKAIEDGRVARLPRMGEKTAQNILHQLRLLRKKKSEQRVPLGIALPVAESLVEAMKGIPGLKNLTPAGSLRRFRDTIGDIDLIGTADNPEEAIEAFVRLPQVKEILEKGSTKASVFVTENLQVDLRLVDHDSFGSALQYATGSKQHNIELRKRAERMGLSLSEYGITNLATGQLEKYATEEAFYHRQGLSYIPPEIREGQHEIELAEKNALPDLVELSDIKGDLHVHTNWSDGRDSLEDMIKAALDKGYQYIAISDHSGGLGIAHGLNIERLQQQIQKIREINHLFPGIHVMTAAEVDIRVNGTLDLPDEILAQLDIVLASIHSAMNQSEEQMTQRIIKAIENPHVDIICHPTARLLGEREPVALNIEAVFKAAVENQKALEISAMPQRLDLKDTHIFQAREMGVKLVINTDAHSCDQLNYMRYGVGIARRGWCKPGDILNTLPLKQFQEFLNRHSA